MSFSTDVVRAIQRLEPGQSITFGCAWDGSRYVKHTQTEVGRMLAPVKRTIAYGDNFYLAWNAEQEPVR